MPPLIDIDDLIDSTEVAALLGYRNPNSISVLRARHPDFPRPIVSTGNGRCLLWLRPDIEAWARATGRADLTPRP